MKGQTLERCDMESPVAAGRVPSVTRVRGGSWERAGPDRPGWRVASHCLLHQLWGGVEDLEGTGRRLPKVGTHPSSGMAFETGGLLGRGGGLRSQSSSSGERA